MGTCGSEEEEELEGAQTHRSQRRYHCEYTHSLNRQSNPKFFFFFKSFNFSRESLEKASNGSDALKAIYGIALYPLNRSSLIELGVVSSLISFVVKDERVGIIEDATVVVAQIAGCEETFLMAMGVGVMVDLQNPLAGSILMMKECGFWASELCNV